MVRWVANAPIATGALKLFCWRGEAWKEPIKCIEATFRISCIHISDDFPKDAINMHSQCAFRYCPQIFTVPKHPLCMPLHVPSSSRPSPFLLWLNLDRQIHAHSPSGQPDPFLLIHAHTRIVAFYQRCVRSLSLNIVHKLLEFLYLRRCRC